MSNKQAQRLCPPRKARSPGPQTPNVSCRQKKEAKTPLAEIVLSLRRDVKVCQKRCGRSEIKFPPETPSPAQAPAFFPKHNNRARSNLFPPPANPEISSPLLTDSPHCFGRPLALIPAWSQEKEAGLGKPILGCSEMKHPPSLVPRSKWAAPNGPLHPSRDRVPRPPAAFPPANRQRKKKIPADLLMGQPTGKSQAGWGSPWAAQA